MVSTESGQQASQPLPPCEDDSLIEAALKVLNCSDVKLKAEYTNLAVALWRNGNMSVMPAAGKPPVIVPERPAREDTRTTIVHPGQAPKRGKGGTLASRQAIVHSLVHIESWAIDLSWDIVVRYTQEHPMPRDFYDDFVTVAEDECRHYLMLEKRLVAMGSHYGAVPVHDGLWESATNTSSSLPARLAVEHCTHEARGLDVLPSTIAKFRNNGDEETAQLLEATVYPEEVTHCAAGIRWLKYLHELAHGRVDAAGSPLEAPAGPLSDAPWAVEARRFHKVEDWFHHLCQPPYFYGQLKPPFNTHARHQAGMTEEWYMPRTPEQKSQGGGDAAGAAGAGSGC